MALLLTAMAPAGLVSAEAPVESRTFSYRCDGEQQPVVVFIEGDRGHLFAAEVSQALRLEPAEATYRGENVRYVPDRLSGVGAGQSAEISVNGRRLLDCRNDVAAAIWESAKLRGVSYRAVGQEPSWVLEVDREHGFLLVTENGSKHNRFPYVQPLSDEAGRTSQFDTRNEGDSMLITISGQDCHDSMSGEAFSSRVKIIWRESVLYGCGRALH